MESRVSQKKSISIIIPIFNGADFLNNSLDQIDAFIAKQGMYAFEFIFVNDGSNDDTTTILKRHTNGRDDCTVISLVENQGKGAALRMGMRQASGQLVGFTDADLPYGLEIFIRMADYFHQDPKLSFVFGSRKHSLSQETKKYPFIRKMGSLFFSFVVRSISRIDVKDTQCGVKLFSRKFAQVAAERSVIRRFAFDIELFVIARVNKLQTRDIDVTLNHRKTSSVRVIRDTLCMLVDILRIQKRACSTKYHI